MVQSDATTVADYLNELPPERREVVSSLRDLILQNLPEGYAESMSWGMINYEVPLGRYPDTYNGKPLCYVGLSAQKNHYALYLMGVYADPGLEEQLREDFETAGKKLDMGKSCVRFKRLDQIPFEAIGRVIAARPIDDFIELYEAARRKS